MSDIRKGVTQASFNESASNFVVFEIIIIAILSGVGFESWWVFGGVFLGLLIAFFIPVVNMVVGVVASICWGVFAGLVSGFFFLDPDIINPDDHWQNATVFVSNGATLVPFILVFLSSLGAHIGAVEWVRDLNDPENRNIG